MTQTQNINESIIAKPYYFDKKNGFLNFPGSYKNYKITLVNYDPLNYEENLVEITCLKLNGVIFTEKSVRYINFDDVRNYSIDERKPMHVSDIIDITEGQSVLTIDQNDILKNDFNLLDDNQLKVRSIKNQLGLTAQLREDGSIKIYFDEVYKGIASFEYTIEDSRGIINDSDIQVFFRSDKMPKDPEFFDQWYLQEANVIPAWELATGKNITVAVFDEGIVPKHDDIKNNLISSSKIYPEFGAEIYGGFRWGKLYQQYFHALGVAGTIAAERNDKDLVGVAYDAKIASYQNIFALVDETYQYSIIKYDWCKDYDVINNSWGGYDISVLASLLRDQYETISKLMEKMRNGFKLAADEGRNGLGTNIVFASGNEKQLGLDTAIGIPKLPYSVIVGATNKNQTTSKLETIIPKFSTESSSILVVAPGSNFPTLSVSNINFDENISLKYDDDTRKVAGTSFSAPLVSGIIALMLDANPNLGWRDVKQILAISAKKFEYNDSIKLPKEPDLFKTQSLLTNDYSQANSIITDPQACHSSGWDINNAKFWNGGGMHFSREFGFGMVDGYEAVKLARSWVSKQTSKNMKMITFSTNMNFEYEEFTKEENKFAIHIGEAIEVEDIVLNLSLSVQKISDITLILTSPSGTKSTLLNKFGKPLSQYFSLGQQISKAELGSTNFRGEKSAGKWIFEIGFGEGSSSTGTNYNFIQSIGLKIYGRENSQSNTMYFNNEILTISDYSPIKMDKWKDFSTINTVSFSHEVKINLLKSAKSEENMLGDRALAFEYGNNISNLIAGDGRTKFIGDHGDNLFVLGRGEINYFSSNGGNDVIYIPNIANHKGITIINDFNSNIKFYFGRNATLSALTIKPEFDKELKTIKESPTFRETQELLNNITEYFTSPSYQALFNSTSPKANFSLSENTTLSQINDTVIQTDNWSILLTNCKPEDLIENKNLFFEDYFM